MLTCAYRVVVAALALAVVGLAWSGPASAAREPAATTWVLKQGHDIPSPPPRNPEMRMEGPKLSGSTGCNNFTATLSEEADKRVAIKGVALTRMLCEGPKNEVENAFVRALEQTRFIDHKGSTLTFLSAEKTALLVWQSQNQQKAAPARKVRKKKARRRHRAYRRAAVRRAHGCFIFRPLLGLRLR